MSNPWIAHVKKYAKDNNLTYQQSMKQAKASYKGKSHAPAPAPKRKRTKKNGTKR